MDFLINSFDTLVTFAATNYLSMIGNGLSVVLGLGAVIFFHELGHFAVAKWCDVHVERFSIGLGPIIWSRQKGETEYALGILPFGGYVKMLGQDDMDPSQMTADEIAENPRSYSSKKVWQRMAIISAGVIMNIITGFLFFATAYFFGVVEDVQMIGFVDPGGAAWEEGIRPGDMIEKIDGEEVQHFREIQQHVVLSRGALRFEGKRADGSEFDLMITPRMGEMMRGIGAGSSKMSTISTMTPEEIPITLPGFAAEKASEPFLRGDRIVAINDEPVSYFRDIARLSAKFAREPMVYTIERPEKLSQNAAPGAKPTTTEVKITVPPKKMRSIGLWMAIGKITAIRKGSIAEKAGLQLKDRIIAVDDLEVGKVIDPLTLPNYFADRAGEEIVLTVDRQRSGDNVEKVTIKLTPDDTPGWSEQPGRITSPLPISAIGAGFHVQPRIAHIVADSEADKSGKFEVGQRIAKIQLEHRDPKNIVPDSLGDKEITTVELPEPDADDAPPGELNWAYVFAQIQQVPNRRIRVHVSDKSDGSGSFGYLFENDEEAEDFYSVVRGIRGFEGLTRVRVADGVGDACALALRETKSSGISIYMTLRSLVQRNLSTRALSGPLGIVNIGYKVANDGMTRLLMFLGFLSINLAILNFLPIPVLDGGHMVFLIWEAVTRRKPSPKVIEYAHLVGFVFIIMLFVFVLYLDIFVNGFAAG